MDSALGPLLPPTQPSTAFRKEFKSPEEESNFKKATRLGLLNTLTSEQMDDITDYVTKTKADLEDAKKSLGQEAHDFQVDEIISIANEKRKKYLEEGDQFRSEKARKLIDELLPGIKGKALAAGFGVAKGAMGPELSHFVAEKSPLGRKAEVAGEIHPIIEAGAHTAEQIGEFVTGGKLEKMALEKLAGAGIKAFAKKAFEKKTAKEIAKKAIVGGAEMAAIQGAMTAKDEALGTVAGSPVDIKKIAIESAKAAPLGVAGVLAAEGIPAAAGAIKAKKAAKYVEDVKAKRAAYLEGKTPEQAAEVAALPILPHTPEAGTEKLGFLTKYLTRKGGTPGIKEAAEKSTKAYRETLIEGGPLIPELQKDFESIPENLRIHYLEAFRGRPFAHDLISPEARKSLESMTPEDFAAYDKSMNDVMSARKAGEKAREKITGPFQMGGITPLQEKAAEAAQKAGISDPEFFDRISSYLTRQYALFDDPKWMPAKETIYKFAKTLQKEAGIAEVNRQIVKGAALPERVAGEPFFHKQFFGPNWKNEILGKEYEEQLVQKIDAFIQDIKLGSQQPYKAGAAKVEKARNVRSLLESRADLPPAYRELLGEIITPTTNLESTIHKLASIRSQAKLITELDAVPGLVMPEKEYTLRKAIGEFAPGTERVKVPEGRGILSGKYMTGAKAVGKDNLPRALVDEAFYSAGLDFVNSGLGSALDNIQKFWKWSHVVANPFSHPAQIISNHMNAALTKSIPGVGKNGMEALRLTTAAMKDFVLGKPMLAHKHWLELYKEGQVMSEFVSGELSKTATSGIGDVLGVSDKEMLGKFVEGLAKNPAENGATAFIANNPSLVEKLKTIPEMTPELVKNFLRDPVFFERLQSSPAVQMVNRLYQAEDQFFKLNDYTKQILNGTDHVSAIKNIDAHWPNYAKVSLLVKNLQKYPLAGPFATFQFETMRNYYNFFKEAGEALAKGDPYPAAKVISILSAPGRMRQIAREDSGLDEKQLSIIDANQKEWNKGATYFKNWTTGETQGVNTQRYVPFAKFDYLYETFKRMGSGALSPSDGAKEILLNTQGLNNTVWWTIGQMLTRRGGTDIQPSLYPQGAPAFGYSKEETKYLGDIEKKSLAPTFPPGLGVTLGQAVAPEMIKAFIDEIMVPTTFGDYTYERYKDIFEGVKQGQVSEDQLLGFFLGGRVFTPRTADEIAAAELGKGSPGKIPYYRNPERITEKNLEKKSKESKQKLYREAKAAETILRGGLAPQEEEGDGYGITVTPSSSQ